MASTSTASLNQSVTGYIHNVTPLRHGVKRQYFEGVLQQRHKVCKVVVFKVELHSKFLKIEKDRCPVQLNNVVVQPSRREDGMDILFTHQSKWCCLTSIDYPYNPTIMVTIQDQTISQILQIDMEYHRVNITAKLIQRESEGHAFLQDDVLLEKAVYTIADTTGIMELTVWGEQNLQLDSWFYITNVSLRMFRGTKFLSTTKDTKFTPTTCTDPTFPLQPTTSEQVTGNIIGAKVTIIYICPLKHKLHNMALSCTRVLCDKCDIFYRTDAITLHTHARLKITTTTSDEIKSVNIENHVLRATIQIPKNATTDTIMDSILDLPTMNITIHNHYITHLAYPEKSHTDTPQPNSPLVHFSPPTQPPAPSEDLAELDLFMVESPLDTQPKVNQPTPPSPTSIADTPK
ncbi:uncharacterized protein LOC113116484 [Carassius auratus]|uniref:Uncharacterized protein LOC113073811 n=1 Tax=Carassius auratus TaxID=7957 RepID=A0A6P6N1Y6_CARAU|nr:uncharacterized protein LOC113073811 [Carassius auratus]XP_026102438.1 uncharacterized protein LOC113073965 [Carassius auratus]XP_026140461.1 uncharacterized protein LOC113116484 [Carassius auratus]